MNKYKAQSRKAQKVRKLNAMCINKRRFETEAEAYQKGQRVYKCPHCGGWHRSGKFAELVSVCKRKSRALSKTSQAAVPIPSASPARVSYLPVTSAHQVADRHNA